MNNNDVNIQDHFVAWILALKRIKHENPNVLKWFVDESLKDLQIFEILTLIQTTCLSLRKIDKENYKHLLFYFDVITRYCDFAWEDNLKITGFKFLEYLGLFNGHYHEYFNQYSIPYEFHSEDMKLVHEQIDNSLSTANRIFFEDGEVFTIDDALTRDYDDAFSVLFQSDEKVQVVVHISDLGDIVVKDHIILKIAMERLRSFYLTAETVPMLPKIISEDLYSLKAGEKRKTLSFIFTFDKDLNIIQFDLKRTWIKVQKNYSYEEVETILEDTQHQHFSLFNYLYQIARGFQKTRLVDNGGVDFVFPQLSTTMKDQEITLCIDRQDLKSFLLVKEWMIKINVKVAEYFDSHQLPAVFLGQDDPEDLYLFQQLPSPIITDIKSAKQWLKKMKKGHFSTTVNKHFALGVLSYTQISSPLRRLGDLMMQKQLIESYFYQETYFSVLEIDQLMSLLSKNKSRLTQFEKAYHTYAILRYLKEKHNQQPLEAEIVKEASHYYLAEVALTRSIVKVRLNNRLYQEGDKVNIILYDIIPYLGIALGNIVES